jgi:acyl-CoA dehydrogenase
VGNRVAGTEAARSAGGDALISAARLAASVAAEGAVDADRGAAFPSGALACLREHRLLAAAVPADLGGCGCDLRALVDITVMLARGCGATAMIWAMHQLQVACLARHSASAPRLREMLAGIVHDQSLVASVTSERGVGGNIRVSQAAMSGDGPVRSMDKQATTVSYGRQAGAFLVTLRRDPAAAPGDQVAVLVDRSQATLDLTGAWNPMGMRGTVSPALRLRATFDVDQVLPEPFADIASTTMLPLSHVLWSAVWVGLATEAYERARRMARARHRPGASSDPRLAHADAVLGGLEARLSDEVARFARCYEEGEPLTIVDLVRSNALKLTASVDSVRVAELALEICGMAGYQEEGEFSVARILRDLYSARLMVANDRLLATNATSLLAVRRG